jgi:hypothetical protein
LGEQVARFALITKINFQCLQTLEEGGHNERLIAIPRKARSPALFDRQIPPSSRKRMKADWERREIEEDCRFISPRTGNVETTAGPSPRQLGCTTLRLTPASIAPMSDGSNGVRWIASGAERR